jgi:anti-sigma B factor antagonist
MLTPRFLDLARNRPPDSTRLKPLGAAVGVPRDVALLRFLPSRTLFRPVSVAPPRRRVPRVTGPQPPVTNGNDQPRTGPQRGRVAIELNGGRDAITVFIRGELDLMTAPVLDEQLRLAVANKPARLVLDMSGTDFMDCGCARLIAAARSALPADADLIIRQPSRVVRRVLELTGLDVHCERQA